MEVAAEEEMASLGMALHGVEGKGGGGGGAWRREVVGMEAGTAGRRWVRRRRRW